MHDVAEVEVAGLTRFGGVTADGKGEAVEGHRPQPARRQQPQDGRGRQGHPRGGEAIAAARRAHRPVLRPLRPDQQGGGHRRIGAPPGRRARPDRPVPVPGERAQRDHRRDHPAAHRARHLHPDVLHGHHRQPDVARRYRDRHRHPRRFSRGHGREHPRQPAWREWGRTPPHRVEICAPSRGTDLLRCRHHHRIFLADPEPDRDRGETVPPAGYHHRPRARRFVDPIAHRHPGGRQPDHGRGEI